MGRKKRMEGTNALFIFILSLFSTFLFFFLCSKKKKEEVEERVPLMNFLSKLHASFQFYADMCTCYGITL